MKAILLKFSLVVACLLCAASCDEDNGEEPGKLRLRISNNSSIAFDEIYVNSNGGEHEFGSLAPHRISEYAEFQYIHRYAYIRVEAGDKTYVVQPIDYFGETKYYFGSYTYILDVADPESTYGLTLEFRKD